MRARDVGVLVASCVAGLVTLQRSSTVVMKPQWLYLRQVSAEASKGGVEAVFTPPPLVTDLDGDGEKEIVFVDDSGTVKVLGVSNPNESGDVPAEAKVLMEAKSGMDLRLAVGTRPVATAAGYLEPFQGQHRKQHIVVVRADWTVLCYDHNLELVWARGVEPKLGGEESRGRGALGAHYEIDQVAVTITSHSVAFPDDQQTQADGTGDEPESSLGLVVVGGSMRATDDRGRSTGRGGVGKDDAKGDSESNRQQLIDEEEREREAAQHFSLHALSGADGRVVWTHQGGDWAAARSSAKKGGSSSTTEQPQDGKEQAKQATEDESEGEEGRRGHLLSKRQQYKVPDHEAQREERENFGSWRLFSKSLLEAGLPHSWRGLEDTALTLARLDPQHAGKARTAAKGNGSGGMEMGRAGKESGGARSAAAGGGRRKTKKKKKRSPERHLPGISDVAVPLMATLPHDESEHIASPNVILAHSREGVEAISLKTGHPVCLLPLPAPMGRTRGRRAGEGSGVYADINGDGVIDHAHVIERSNYWAMELERERSAKASASEGATDKEAPQEPLMGGSSSTKPYPLPSCYTLVSSGVPPQEQLFNGSLCHREGALASLTQDKLGRRHHAQPSTAGRRNKGKDLRRMERVMEGKVAVTAATPLIVDHPVGEGSYRTTLLPDKDVVFAVSEGVITSYDSGGAINWQDSDAPKWDALSLAREGDGGGGGGEGVGLRGGTTGYLLHFPMRAPRPGLEGPRLLGNEHILVVGKQSMALYSHWGNKLGGVEFLAQQSPVGRPVVGDFNNDGTSDIVVVGPKLIVGYAVHEQLGTPLLFWLVLLSLMAVVLTAICVSATAPLEMRGGGTEEDTGGPTVVKSPRLTAAPLEEESEGWGREWGMQEEQKEEEESGPEIELDSERRWRGLPTEGRKESWTPTERVPREAGGGGCGGVGNSREKETGLLKGGKEIPCCCPSRPTPFVVRPFVVRAGALWPLPPMTSTRESRELVLSQVRPELTSSHRLTLILEACICTSATICQRRTLWHVCHSDVRERSKPQSSFAPLSCAPISMLSPAKGEGRGERAAADLERTLGRAGHYIGQGGALDSQANGTRPAHPPISGQRRRGLRLAASVNRTD